MNLLYYYTKIIKRLRGKAIRNSTIDHTSFVGVGSNVYGVTMGRYSYCSHDCQIVDTEIGAFCSISDHVFIGGAEHPTDWVSTSPVFQDVQHSGPTKRFAEFDIHSSKKTIIGNDVWIGHGATIKKGVTIGNGAVIGSNALVTKDVPPYAIVGGVPAKIIKYRFDEGTITLLLESQWWNMTDDEIKALAAHINNPDYFIEELKKHHN